MKLSSPPPKYDQTDEMKTRTQLERMDGQNRKRGADLEIAGAERLILPDTVTGQRYSLTIQSGAVVLVLIP